MAQSQHQSPPTEDQHNERLYKRTGFWTILIAVLIGWTLIGFVLDNAFYKPERDSGVFGRVLASAVMGAPIVAFFFLLGWAQMAALSFRHRRAAKAAQKQQDQGN